MRKSHKEKAIIREIINNVEELDINDKYKDIIYDFFSSTMRLESPIPSLCLVENQNVVIYWICGSVSIEVDFDETGACYMWGINSQGEKYSSENYTTIIDHTSILLREMEDILKENNPDWKEKYLMSMQQASRILQ